MTDSESLSPGRKERLCPGFVSGCSSRMPWRLALGVAVGLFLAQWAIGGLPRYWDPDSALYILNAQNIAQGESYGATLFIPNALNPIHPGSYPPGLPLLLAPVLAFAGLDLGALALVTYACFCALVGVTYLLARLSLGPWPSLAVAALVAFNPLLAFVSGAIYSEYPFLLAVFAAFVCLEIAQADRLRSSRVARLLAVLAGALIGYAVLVRTVGVLLLPAVAVAAALAWLRQGRDGTRLVLPAIALTTGAGVAALVSWSMPHDAGTYVSYFGQESLAGVLQAMNEGLRTYVPVLPEELFAGRVLSGVGSGTLATLSWALSIVASGFAAIGIAVSLHRRSSVIEVFALLYAAFILVYPIRLEPPRYALPLLPLFLLYFVVGIDWLRTRLGRASYHLAWGLLGVALILVYLPSQVGQRSPLPPPWVSSGAAHETFAAIQAHTSRQSLVVAPDPTSVALFAARRATIWPKQANDAEVRKHVHGAGVTHLLLRPPASPVAKQDYSRFVAANADWLRPIWVGSEFALFAVRPEAANL